MSRVYADNVYPELVTEDLTLGASGDSVVVTSGASLNVNTLKDSGGNTLCTSNGSGVQPAKQPHMRCRVSIHIDGSLS